jgi:hypothetical protein
MKVAIDLGRLPDDPGKRADIYHALRILGDNKMIESLVWDREAARIV